MRASGCSRSCRPTSLLGASASAGKPLPASCPSPKPLRYALGSPKLNVLLPMGNATLCTRCGACSSDLIVVWLVGCCTLHSHEPGNRQIVGCCQMIAAGHQMASAATLSIVLLFASVICAPQNVDAIQKLAGIACCISPARYPAWYPVPCRLAHFANDHPAPTFSCQV